jgi:hypothetical protein
MLITGGSLRAGENLAVGLERQAPLNRPSDVCDRQTVTQIKMCSFLHGSSLPKCLRCRLGLRMHEHTAAGRISVHTLNGHIRIHLPERVVDLPAGNLLALDQCVSHDVEASEDSVFLLTLSWPLEAKIAEAKPRGKEITRPKRK